MHASNGSIIVYYCVEECIIAYKFTVCTWISMWVVSNAIRLLSGLSLLQKGNYRFLVSLYVMK